LADAAPDLNQGRLSEGPPLPGDGGMRRLIARTLRVDHAGEFGAVQIYRGQRAVFSSARGKERISALLEEMEAGEQHHLDTFDRLLAERGVRPTALSPLWRAAGYALGAGTALLGEKAAYACTAAVEDVIEEHYAAQAARLRGRDPALAALVEQFGKDETAHKDTALSEGAREMLGYGLFAAVIKAGCRAAIRISEKI